METVPPEFKKKNDFYCYENQIREVKRLITHYRGSNTFPIIYLEKVCYGQCPRTVLVFLRAFEYDLEMFLSIYLSVLHRFDRPKKKNLC